MTTITIFRGAVEIARIEDERTKFEGGSLLFYSNNLIDLEKWDSFQIDGVEYFQTGANIGKISGNFIYNIGLSITCTNRKGTLNH
jgi:hypothetical protein